MRRTSVILTTKITTAGDVHRLAGDNRLCVAERVKMQVLSGQCGRRVRPVIITTSLLWVFLYRTTSCVHDRSSTIPNSPSKLTHTIYEQLHFQQMRWHVAPCRYMYKLKRQRITKNAMKNQLNASDNTPVSWVNISWSLKPKFSPNLNCIWLCAISWENYT